MRSATLTFEGIRARPVVLENGAASPSLSVTFRRIIGHFC